MATALTNLPGSSAVYLGGVTAYDNTAKINLLQVSPEILKQVGAVSPQAAEAMALGAKRQLGSTYAVALTGIAGPGGGTKEKPVGTVYCGIAGRHGVRSVLWLLAGDRDAIRQAARSEEHTSELQSH